MKKTLLLILSLLLILPLAVSCGNGANEGNTTTGPEAVASSGPDAENTTDSKYDDKGFEKDDLRSDYNFGDEIGILMWNDYTMTEFYVEETNGNNIDSAIFRRNANVCDRLGIELKYYESRGSGDYINEYIAKVDADYKSSDHTYDIYATYSRTPPTLSLSGYLRDLKSEEYINTDKPWWPKALVDECEINGKLFFASGDISTNLLWMMTGTFYNRDIYNSMTGNELYSKTPEELVEDNEWTMERLFSMTKDTYVDSDDDHKKSAGDTFGMIIYQVNIDAFQTAAGITSIIKNPDGHLGISPDFNGQRAADVCELVGNFLAGEGVYYENKTTIRDIFFNQQATFIMDRCFIVAGKDNSTNKSKIDFPFGIIPQPKYTKDQANYSTNVGHPFTMYAIGESSSRPDVAAATLECLASESYRLVTPEVFEMAMKVRYADAPESAKMYDILRETVSFDIGRLYAESFGNYTANAFRTNAISTPTAYLRNVARQTGTINKGLDKIESVYFN